MSPIAIVLKPHHRYSQTPSPLTCTPCPRFLAPPPHQWNSSLPTGSNSRPLSSSILHGKHSSRYDRSYTPTHTAIIHHGSCDPVSPCWCHRLHSVVCSRIPSCSLCSLHE